jgi:hypothetical protein
MSIHYPGSETLPANTQTPPGSKPLVRPEAIIKADALSYLLWDVADLEKQEDFLIDFGMLTSEKSNDHLLMKTFGSDPYVYVGRKAKKHKFIGMGVSVLSRDDLVTLANATNRPIEQINRKGGGEVVKLEAPNGVQVEVTFGIQAVESTQTREHALPVNTPTNKLRVNTGQRAPLAPAPVTRLGHCVTAANNMEEVSQWYMRHLGVIPTDVLCLEDASPVIAFMRFDRGDKPSDHHSIVIGKGGGKGYLHSAYEVVDIDAIAQGQQYLKNKRHKHVWGIGRHILGSQVFDYWHDPAGCEFEHYTDGDVFTSDHPTGYYPMDPGNIYAWGQDMPKDMMAPSFKQLLVILGGLFNGNVTLNWLKSIKKATSRPARPWL